MLGDHGDIWSDQNEDEEHAWIDKLPPGVIFPAPNFGDAVKCADYNLVKDWMDLDTGCIYEIFYYYENTDFPQQRYGYSYDIFDVDDRKIVKGDGKDLLVFEVMIENESDSPARLYHKYGNQGFKMYDGKDREFTVITSTMLVGLGGSPTEDPAFSWNEACPFYNIPTEIQPGIEKRVILCFEIPKNSDHFKVVYDRVSGFGNEFATGVVLLFDRDAIKHQTQQQVVKSTEPTSTSIELLFIALAVVAVSGIVGAVLIAKRGTNTKSAQQKLEEYEDEYLKAGNQAGNQDLEEYEKEYLARQGQRPSPKPARVEKTTLFCDSCGTPFKSEARFCGECGTPRS